MKIHVFIFVSISLFVFSCKKKNDTPIISKISFNSEKTYGTITDADNNSYKTIQIGNQVWMAENLKTTKFNDNTEIPNVTVGTEWDALTTAAYCTYNNTSSEDTIDVYGLLYNWNAVNSQKLCPTGWHVPTLAEWDTLAKYTDSVAADLKEIGEKHWSNTSDESTNSFGFTAIPAGARTGEFFGHSTFKSKWWSSTYRYGNKSYMTTIEYNKPNMMLDYEQTQNGLSVRCVKD